MVIVLFFILTISFYEGRITRLNEQTDELLVLGNKCTILMQDTISWASECVLKLQVCLGQN